jgi:hypothetical protein
LLKTKLYKLTNTLIGLIIGLGATWYLISIFQERTAELKVDSIIQQLSRSLVPLILVIVLMPMNWLMETLKWRSLVQEVTAINFLKAIRSVLFGISLSLLTPNRVGELGGRLLYIPKEVHLKVLYTNTLCSLSQLFITVIVAFVLIPFSPFEMGLSKPLIWTIIISLIAFLLYFYFSSNLIKRIIFKLNDRFQFKKSESMVQISLQSRLRTLLFSAIRYGIFLMQFSLLICIFDEK